MNTEDLFKKIQEFSDGNHGNTDYDKDEVFVKGDKDDSFAPLSFLCKKLDFLSGASDLQKNGFILDSHEFLGNPHFIGWFERQFSRKFLKKKSKKTQIIHLPNNKAVFDSIESVHKAYDVLRSSKIILNGKNLPVQLGEWYAKCIFGLEQRKSASQRGFDFYIKNKRVEVRVHWADHSSPKGVKIRKSMLNLSDYTVILYIAKNFMIREVCFLDSEYIERKFAGKGHTTFLKDSDINTYFFSKSQKHFDKVTNPTALLKFSTPTLAMKISEHFHI